MLKKNVKIINIVSLIIFGCMLYVFVHFYFIQKQNEHDSNVEYIELETQLSLLPVDSPPNIAFTKYAQDQKITKEEYESVKLIYSNYMKSFEWRKINKINMTPLEKAKDNLDAFNDVGYLIVPPDKIELVREEMKKKIKKLEKDAQKLN